MTKNFDFIDDLPTANARVAEHEARLGLPKSEARIDIVEANTVLRGLALVSTPAKPAPPAIQPPAAPESSASITPDDEPRRALRTYRPQSYERPNDAPGFPKDGKLHGASLLAAHYAKQA